MVLFLLIILIMISVYWRPMWGILRGLLLGFLFLIGGSSLNVPVPVSFVVFVLYCQLGTPWLRKIKLPADKSDENISRIDNHRRGSLHVHHGAVLLCL